jgi:hypothetical protein
VQREEKGQSIVEIAVTLPFLIVIVIALVEMGIVFASYLSLVNAAREGAVFASMYSELSDPQGRYDNRLYGGVITGTVTISNEYTSRVFNEIFVALAEPLRASQLLDQDRLIVDRPVLAPTSSSCPTALEAGCPITVTVHFRIHTLTSDMSLPGVGRLGLPNYYQMNYSIGMPIR